MALILVGFLAPSLVFAQWTDDDLFNTPLGDKEIKMVNYLSTKGKVTKAEAEEIVRSSRGTHTPGIMLQLMMAASGAKVKGKNKEGYGLMGISKTMIDVSKIDSRFDFSMCGVEDVQDLYKIRKSICAADEIYTGFKNIFDEGDDDEEGAMKPAILAYGVQQTGKNWNDKAALNSGKAFLGKVIRYTEEIYASIYDE
jgi:hypothetical protein